MGDNECETTLVEIPEADEITEELLRKMLETVKGKRVVIEHFQVTPATKKGENYSSVLVKVSITYMADSIKEFDSIIIKLLENDKDARQWALNITKTFAKELCFYTHYLSMLIQAQKRRNLDTITLPNVPKFYHGKVTREIGMIALEDLKMHGYRTVATTNSLDVEHCKKVMTELGKFHALSYVVKEELTTKQHMGEYWYVYHEAIYHKKSEERYLTLFQASFRAALATAKMNMTDTRTKKKFDRLYDINLYDTIIEFIHPREPYSVVCHGDLWQGNILFKYCLTNNNLPLDIKLIDFQEIRFAPLTIDLVTFFYMNTSSPMRQRHLQELLRVYYNVFRTTLQNLEIEDKLQFTLSELEQEYKNDRLCGALKACVFLPIMYAGANSQVDIYERDSDELMRQISTSLQANPHIIDRLQDIVMEIMESVKIPSAPKM